MDSTDHLSDKSDESDNYDNKMNLSDLKNSKFFLNTDSSDRLSDKFDKSHKGDLPKSWLSIIKNIVTTPEDLFLVTFSIFVVYLIIVGE